MLCRHLHVFPVVMAFYLPVTFFITYGMAVHYDHVESVFPYISDTGTISPESCVFGQLLNIYAALTFWCMYLRYKQVRRYYRYTESQGLESGSPRCKSVRQKQIINRVCLVIGVVTALGISMVANFQEDNVLEVHLLGAIMAFGGAGLYCWVQSLISYKMANLPSSRTCCRHIRVFLCVIYTFAFFIMVISTKLSMDKFPLSIKDMKKWKSSQPGYMEHLFATFAEWLMAFISSAYFLTFTGELRVVRTKMLILPITREITPQDKASSSTGRMNRGGKEEESGDTQGSEPGQSSDAASVDGGDCGKDGGGGGGGKGDSPVGVLETASCCELVVGKVSN